MSTMKCINDELHPIASFSKTGNIKIGHMWTWNTLKGNDIIDVNYNGLAFTCKGTCGKICEDCGCTHSCYVNKSYNLYPNVPYGHAINTLALRNHFDETFIQLDKQLKRARKRPKYVRIHSSGEFESLQEINMFNELAKRYPDVTFYVYSKAFMLWDMFLNNNVLEHNFILNVSIWHDSGIDFFQKWKYLPNIKAYVYDDNFNYTALGLTVNVHCPAYGKNGKMDHDKTCDKCGMCMTLNPRYKIIACYDHS